MRVDQCIACALSAAIAVSSAQAQTTKKAKPAPPPTLRFVVAPTGNEARYRVREQLAGFDLPNDAVGVTHEVTGMLVVNGSGVVVGDSSRIVVGLKTLKSDKDRRDGFVQRRVLETDKFPTVELAPKTFLGLAARPESATNFDVVGDLQVHGVSRPTTWKVTAHSEGADVVGTATTAFTFKDFGLDQPKVPVVLSVADTIKLEYDFRFTPAPSKGP